MDALIEDLESEDGHEIDDEEETTPGGGRVVPEDQLQTDSRVGLTEAEVIARRKKWGLNAMKEERENMILKFLMFFVGPIQFVMASFTLLSLALFSHVLNTCDFPRFFTLLRMTLFALLFSHVSKLCDFSSIFYTFSKMLVLCPEEFVKPSRLTRFRRTGHGFPPHIYPYIPHFFIMSSQHLTNTTYRKPPPFLPLVLRTGLISVLSALFSFLTLA